MLRSLYRSSTGQLTQNLATDQIREALKDSQGTLWLDLTHSNSADQPAALLKELFAFHPLALDDAFQEAHVPRIDDWQDYLYIVFHAINLEINRTLDTQEVDVFLGRNYLITIHVDLIHPLDHVWDQCCRGAERRLASGPDHLLYALADAIVADYMNVVEGLDDELDELEHEIFAQPTPQTISRIFRTRRSLLRLRRILGPLREVMNRLARDDYAVIDDKDRVYFRDVYDHLVRLYDIVEGLRDTAAGALETYMTVTSTRISEVMRTLTVVTVLFMPISFLASFFGMNFFGGDYHVNNPVSANVWFWICIGIMIAAPPIMLVWMARHGWLRSIGRDSDAAQTGKVSGQ